MIWKILVSVILMQLATVLWPAKLASPEPMSEQFAPHTRFSHPRPCDYVMTERCMSILRNSGR